MSGGTPTAGGGFVRQRFSQGYSSSGEDLEDDACSTAPVESSLPSVRRARTWAEVAENLVTALHLGLATAVLNVGLVLYTTYFLLSPPPKAHEKSEALSTAAPLLLVFGLLSFFFLSYALWPIWNILTIPLLFTLFMASVVISPYLQIGPLKTQSVGLRSD